MKYIGQFSENHFKETKICLFIEKQLAEHFTSSELAWMFINQHLDNIRSTLLMPAAGSNGSFDFSEQGMLSKINTALSVLRHEEVDSMKEWEEILKQFDKVLDEKFTVMYSDDVAHVYTKDV